MHYTIVLAALAATPGSPAVSPAVSLAAPAASITVEEFKLVQEQLRALTQRVATLEESNAELQRRNQDLERVAAAPAAAVAAPAPGPGQTSSAGSTLPSGAAASPPASASAEWINKFKWSGDFRLRHEQIEQRALATRERERLQAHFGFEAQATDGIALGLQLASGGDDPRAANQTMTGTFSRKSIGLDLAYARWALAPGVTLVGGKMKYPVYRPGLSKLYDSDVNPEGIALTFNKAGLFGSLYGFSLEERAAAADTGLVGLQGGAKFGLGDDSVLTATLGYSDLTAGVGRTPFFNSQPNGNTLAPDGTLAYDFQVLQGSVDLGTTLFATPVMAFVDYARNRAAPEDLDTAYSTGFLLGRAGGATMWEFGYLYQRVEKDAWFGQLTDSDFGAGLTDARGSVFRIAFAPAKNWLLTATYYLNDLALSDAADGSSTSEYRRLQLDFNLKY